MPKFFETTIELAKADRLVLRLISESGGQKVERELLESDGSNQVQVWCYRNHEELKSFFDADPFYETYRARFEQVLNEAAKHLQSKSR